MTSPIAQAKGRKLGIFKPHEEKPTEARERKRGEEFWIEVCGWPVPAKNTKDGIRAVKGTEPIDPADVQRYLEGKFGDDLQWVRTAMEKVAKSLKPTQLARRHIHFTNGSGQRSQRASRAGEQRAILTWG